MSHVKIIAHCVWGTYNHQKILVKPEREKLFFHILENARNKEIYIDFINGYVDHIHCLISLGTDQTISKVIQNIKGEASHWANKEKLFKHKLEWANEYFAASVSESSLNRVRLYIKNQEEHHKKMTFKEEYESFLKSHGFNLG